MPNANSPFHPIIYVRGYAMTRGEQDDTTADPFCGFNLGSTVYRATPDKDKPAKKFIFESPVLRLASDFGYADVFEDGFDIMDDGWNRTVASKTKPGQYEASSSLPNRSIVVFRYYEQASALLGKGETPEITDFAKELGRLILRVRELVCADPENAVSPEDFRCYLVAHSMGGLVCRTFLQNPEVGDVQAKKYVDKVFTYATPHNGIDIVGFNVPKWLGAADISNFNREKMADYLKLESLMNKTGRVDWLPEEAFPSDRFFCMVGTNRADYEAVMGLSRAFVGHGSDGLVRIENASVWGVNEKGQVSSPSPTAYAYRAHSGYFGIVNSEEAYQNLVRFLFGDIRVDVWVDVESVQLPSEIQGKAVNGLYQFEVLASPRAKRWYLTRRVAEEDSVACRSHQDLIDPANKAARSVFLSTIFLANRARVNQDRPSLAYSLTLGVRTPDYEVERVFWPDSHFEGGYLFRDTTVMEIVPPQAPGDKWSVCSKWEANGTATDMEPIDYKTLRNKKIEMKIPFGSNRAPGIKGQLRFVVSAWNA